MYVQCSLNCTNTKISFRSIHLSFILFRSLISALLYHFFAHSECYASWVLPVSQKNRFYCVCVCVLFLPVSMHRYGLTMLIHLFFLLSHFQFIFIAFQQHPHSALISIHIIYNTLSNQVMQSQHSTLFFALFLCFCFVTFIYEYCTKAAWMCALWFWKLKKKRFIPKHLRAEIHMCELQFNTERASNDKRNTH